MSSRRFEGRVALVTGAGHGIGAAIAEALAREGAGVLVHHFRAPWEGDEPDVPGEALLRWRRSRGPEEVLERIRSAGGRAAGIEADLRDEDAPERLFDEAERLLGPVDLLVGNAAVCSPDSFDPESGHPPPRGLDEHLVVNAVAVGALMAGFARRRARLGPSPGGRIVNVSTDGSSGHAGQVSYGASKHAMESYSRAAAWELGRYGITVNVVGVGPVQTGWISPELERELLPHIPVGRIGTPDDVAAAVLFLLSDEASWITGQILYVGGGHVMPL